MEKRMEATKTFRDKLTLQTLFGIAVLILVFLIPIVLIENQYYIRVGISILIWVPMAMSFRLMTLAMEFNMAVMAFMGIGAYTTALLTAKQDWNWWPAAMVGAVICVIMAIILGRIVLRVKGIYFAILTFGMVLVCRFVYLTWPGFFGGTSGIANIPTINGISGSLDSFYLLGLGFMLFWFLIFYRLEKSRYGLTLRSIGQAPELAESVGVHLMRYKVSAFALGAFVSAWVGAFFASVQHFIDPEEFAFMGTLYIVVYAVAGGLTMFWGPLVGVAALFILPIGLKELPGYDPKIEPIIFGGILIAIIMFLPGGIISLPWKIADWTRKIRQRAP
jgi:branched-chain amino acid transport system permease protein